MEERGLPRDGRKINLPQSLPAGQMQAVLHHVSTGSKRDRSAFARSRQSLNLRTISAAGGSESSSISIANPQNAAHGMTRRINHPSVGLGIYGALCCVGVAAFAAWMYGLLQPTSAQNPGSSLRPPPLSATGLPPSSRRRRAKR